MIDATKKTVPLEESPEFLAAWNAPLTLPAGYRHPAEPEPEGFEEAWNAPLAKKPALPDWRDWKQPACRMSQEEAEFLNAPYCYPAIDA